MELNFSVAAAAQIRALPKADAARMLTALREIAATHPQRMAYVTEMAGQPGNWRARKGDYRAIYKITTNGILVVQVGNRKEVYR